MGARKERHHVTPAFYLRGFLATSAPPSLFVFDKDSPTAPRAASPRDAGVRRLYYAFDPEDDYVSPDAYEDFLARIEDAAAPVVRKVARREPLTSNERLALSIFMSFMATRGPSFRDPVTEVLQVQIKQLTGLIAEEEGRFAALHRRYEEQTGTKLALTFQEFKSFSDKAEGSFQINPAFVMSLMTIAFDLARVFLDLRWTFFHSVRPLYLTSDNALVQVRGGSFPYSGINGSILDKDVEVTFPVTQNVGLVCSRRNDDGHFDASRKRVLTINSRTVASAERFIYAPADTPETRNEVGRFHDVTIGIGQRTIRQGDEYLMVMHRQLMKRRPVSPG